MAINFPNAPVNGNTYDYLGIRYTWKDTGGGTGLWQITSPGSYGVATAAEINTGTDPVKYVTPLELKSSKYIEETDVASVLDVFLGTDNIKYISPLGLKGSDYVEKPYVDVKNETVWLSTGDVRLFTRTALSNGQGVPHTVYASSAAYPGIKFAIVRAYMSGSADDSITIFPYGQLASSFKAHDFDEFKWSGQVMVPVDSLGRFYIQWTQVATNYVYIELEGWIR